MPRESVREHGAAGDGDTLDSPAIQSAIDARAEAGGGTVVVPPGTYRCRPLLLRSNIELNLSAGATLVADDTVTEYPTVPGRWNGIELEVYASLITGHDLDNVAITGRGTIDAYGQPWWDAVAEDHDLFDERGFGRMDCFPAPPEANLSHPRPNAIHLQGSTNVRLRDVTVRNSPFWAVHPVYCSNVTVDGLTVENPPNSPNTDGINPDSCRNVHITNCHIDVGDDCVTIKSGFDEDGRRVGKPCENVTITNCTMYHGHGGVVIGSEMSGDVRNVTISNCVFDGTDNGLRIKTERGRGGVVEDVRATNIVMRDLPNTAILVNMHYHGVDEEDHPVTEATPTLREIHYSNLSVNGADTLAAMRGLPERAIEGVSLVDLRARGLRRGIDASRIRDLYCRNCTIDAAGTPAVTLAHADSVDLERVSHPAPHPDIAVFQFEATPARLRNCTARPGTGTLIRTDDPDAVELRDCDIREAETGVALDEN